jgi:hypothetical protein
VACFHRGGGSAPLEVFHPWLRHSLAAGREATAHPRMRQFSHPQLPLEAGRHGVLPCLGRQIWPVWLDSTHCLMLVARLMVSVWWGRRRFTRGATINWVAVQGRCGFSMPFSGCVGMWRLVFSGESLTVLRPWMLLSFLGWGEEGSWSSTTSQKTPGRVPLRLLIPRVTSLGQGQDAAAHDRATTSSRVTSPPEGVALKIVFS